jgi:isopenicillin N synthase-like dioxygenase
MMDVTGTADLDEFRKGNEKQRADFCSKILSMFAKQGFAKILNHGLDEDYVRQGFAYVSTQSCGNDRSILI